MFLMPDSFLLKQRSVHHLNIRNFDSCDVICGTDVLYSIIRDSDLIYIFKMKHCRAEQKVINFSCSTQLNMKFKSHINHLNNSIFFG